MLIGKSAGLHAFSERSACDAYNALQTNQRVVEVGVETMNMSDSMFELRKVFSFIALSFGALMLFPGIERASAASEQFCDRYASLSVKQHEVAISEGVPNWNLTTG